VEPGVLTRQAKEARDAILGGRWRVQRMLTDEAVDRQPFQVTVD